MFSYACRLYEFDGRQTGVIAKIQVVLLSLYFIVYLHNENLYNFTKV